MSMRWTFAAATGAAALALAVAGAPAAFAGQSYQDFTCDGVQLTLRVSDQNSGDQGGWGVGQVVMGGTGHLIPTSFSFSAYDVTTDTAIFGPEVLAKGGGNANRNQQTITCTQDQVMTASDIGGELPPGVSPTDEIRLSFGVTAVHKG